MATRRPSRTRTPKKQTAEPAIRTSKTRTRRGQDLTIQPAAGKPILITDVALRDGHQSLLATRMRTEDMLPIAQKLDAVGYWSLEVWGGATFDTCLRFLKEDPWERLRALRAAMPNTKLQMLLRGQNLVGYRHYADDVLERFIERSATNGIDVFRIFDALNDIRNVERAMREVKAWWQACRSRHQLYRQPRPQRGTFCHHGKTAGGFGNGYAVHQGHGRALGAARRLSPHTPNQSRREGPDPFAFALHFWNGLDDLPHGDPRRLGYVGYGHLAIGRRNLASLDGNTGGLTAQHPVRHRT